MGLHRNITVGKRRTVLAAIFLSVATLAAGCQMAPPPGTSHSPSGAFDEIVLGRFRGWAARQRHR